MKAVLIKFMSVHVWRRFTLVFVNVPGICLDHLRSIRSRCKDRVTTCIFNVIHSVGNLSAVYL